MSITEVTDEIMSGMPSGRPVLKEYEMNFLCGLCSVGFDAIEGFLDHIKEDEHNFHKKRIVSRLVPGLGFCEACYALMQSELNWKGHIIGLKHKNCVATLEAAEALGVPQQSDQYNEPRCCETPGVIGKIIASSDINFKMANNYDFGRGGIIIKGTPLVGLGYIQTCPTTRLDMYQCTLCDERFLFRHRAKHLTGPEHRGRVLERHYPERYANVMSVTYKPLKLLYHCTMVEEEEKSSENNQARKLRAKFLAIPGRGPKLDVPKTERSISRGSRGGGGVGLENLMTDYIGSLLPIKPNIRGLGGGSPIHGCTITGQGGIDLLTHLRAGSSSGGLGSLTLGGQVSFLNHSSKPAIHEPQYINEYSGPYASEGYHSLYAQDQESYTNTYYQEQPVYAPEQHSYTPEQPSYISPYAEESYTVSTDSNNIPYDPYASEVSSYAPYVVDETYNAYVPAKRPPPPQGPVPDYKRPSPPESWAPYLEQRNAKVSKAMAAISILEEFAQSEAGIDVKRKIADIRASVMNVGTKDLI